MASNSKDPRKAGTNSAAKSRTPAAARTPAPAPIINLDPNAPKTDAPPVTTTPPDDAPKTSRRRAEVEDEMVTVTVPNAFKLHVVAGQLIDYPAGIQEMPLSHAEHEYSVANGVEIYKP